MGKGFKVAIDFDGTIVEHRFPDLGKPVPGAFEWMAKWRKAGAWLILWTMRSDTCKNGQENRSVGPVLTQAVELCEKHGMVFDAVNEGVNDREWTDSPKAYASAYVDDNAVGCPLIESKEMGARPMVDWEIVGPAVMEKIKEKLHG